MKKKSELIFNMPGSKGRCCGNCQAGKTLLSIFAGLLVIPTLILLLIAALKDDKEAYY